MDISVPSSYQALTTLIRKNSLSHSSPTLNTICPHCEQLSFAKQKCTKCGADYNAETSADVPTVYMFDITQQLEVVLATSQDLVLNKNHCPKKRMDDIVDGHAYRRIIEKEGEPFITMTMNLDGIQPNKGSDLSLWPVLFVINEIKKKKRYSLENAVIGAMWPGPSKPSRDQLNLIFAKIVSELRDLEDGHQFELYSSDQQDKSEFLKVFLIAVCADKPAQCLLQCLPEPNAYFGCGHCELRGESKIPLFRLYFRTLRRSGIISVLSHVLLYEMH